MRVAHGTDDASGAWQMAAQATSFVLAPIPAHAFDAPGIQLASGRSRQRIDHAFGRRYGRYTTAGVVADVMRMHLLVADYPRCYGLRPSSRSEARDINKCGQQRVGRCRRTADRTTTTMVCPSPLRCGWRLQAPARSSSIQIEYIVN
jgi:hypothetical protein